MARRGAWGSALFLLSPLALVAAETTAVRSYPLPGHGILELSAPTSWKESVSRPPADLPPTIEFSPAEGDSFSVQITPLWSPRSDPEFNRPDVIRPLIETIGRKQLEQSLETEITVREIKGPRASGYFFTVTDRAPAQGEWKYLTAGAAGVGDLLVSFTILTNSLDSGEVDQALRMIEASRQTAIAPAEPSQPPEPSPPPAPAPSTLRKMTYPGKRWSLVLDLPGFEFQERATRPDMTGVRVFGSNDSTGVIISVFLERADHEGDARVCRDFYRKKGRGKGLPQKDLRISERGEMALVEYTFGRVKGLDLNQRNVNAYLSHDGVWIDIHLSKVKFEPSDQRLFDVLLDSVRIVEASPFPARGSPAQPGSPPGPSTQALQAPGRDWVLTLNTLGAAFAGSLQYEFDEKNSEVTAQRVVGSKWEGGSEKAGLVFAVAIGKAQREGDAKACREYFWRPLRYMPTEVDFKPDDRSLFDTVLESLRITETVPSDPRSESPRPGDVAGAPRARPLPEP